MNTPRIGDRFSHWQGWSGTYIGPSAWTTSALLLESETGERRLTSLQSLSQRELWSYVGTRADLIARFLPWWCEQLVRELLWGAWVQMLKREGAALDRAFLRFCRLVNAAPCWPCRIDYAHPGRECVSASGAHFAGLCITSGRAAEDAALWDDEF